jgi:uncharacterized membrane protein YraQ (UPF0718 family)
MLFVHMPIHTHIYIYVRSNYQQTFCGIMIGLLTAKCSCGSYKPSFCGIESNGHGRIIVDM